MVAQKIKVNNKDKETEIVVLHIITSLNTGGAEMMLYKLIKTTDRGTLRPVVVTLMGGGDLLNHYKDLGIDVYSLGMRRGIPSLRSVFKLRKLLALIRPNVVQGWMYHGNLMAWLAKWLCNREVRCYWNIRHCVYSLSDEKRLTTILIKLGAFLSRVPDKILYNSLISCKQHEGLGYHRGNSLVIPNGFDLNTFKPDEGAHYQLCRELGLPSDNLLIGMIGRFHPMKDQRNFLQAASLLLEKYNGIGFFMAGKNVDGNNTVLDDWLQELGLSNKVALLGERLDTPMLNAAMDIAVLSSSSEAFPNVVGEAMACATPCVVTNVGDAAWIVEDTGYVVPKADALALAKGMQQMISLGMKGRVQLGKRARQRIQSLFALDDVVDKYQELYQRKQ